MSTDPTIPADLAAWLDEQEATCQRSCSAANRLEIDDASGRWKWIVGEQLGLHRTRTDQSGTIRQLTIDESWYAADVLDFAAARNALPTALRIIRDQAEKIRFRTLDREQLVGRIDDLLSQLHKKKAIICNQAADNERLRAIIANVTSAILSCGPYQLIHDTNLVVVAQQAAESARGEGDGDQVL